MIAWRPRRSIFPAGPTASANGSCRPRASATSRPSCSKTSFRRLHRRRQPMCICGLSMADRLTIKSRPSSRPSRRRCFLRSRATSSFVAFYRPRRGFCEDHDHRLRRRKSALGRARAQGAGRRNRASDRAGAGFDCGSHCSSWRRPFLSVCGGASRTRLDGAAQSRDSFRRAHSRNLPWAAGDVRLERRGSGRGGPGLLPRGGSGPADLCEVSSYRLELTGADGDESTPARCPRGRLLLFCTLLRRTLGRGRDGRGVSSRCPVRGGDREAQCVGRPVPSGKIGRDWRARSAELPGAGRMTLARRIIPCLDVDGGRVVKGIEFEGLRDMGDPAELAARYNREGADEIVVLDISATHEGRATFLETIRRVAEQLNIPLTAGGGIRKMEDGQAVLRAGADKVTVNTAAVKRPELISELSQQFGAQAVVLSMDVKRVGPSWEIFVRGGRDATGIDAIEWVQEAVSRGAGEILLTSIDRDGTCSGFDCDLTAKIAATVSVPVIASGGASTFEDFRAVFQQGNADAALAASIFHSETHSIAALKKFLAEHGVPVRRKA